MHSVSPDIKEFAMRIIKAWFITIVVVRAIATVAWVAIGPANRSRIKALLRNIESSAPLPWGVLIVLLYICICILYKLFFVDNSVHLTKGVCYVKGLSFFRCTVR